QIVGQKVLSPADLESINCNLVGGDPYSGICSPDQFFWMRPFAASNGARSHATPYKNVYHIGASTHPGPGLAGASGFMVAEQIRYALLRLWFDACRQKTGQDRCCAPALAGFFCYCVFT